jgi:hypothetical protein
MTNEYLDPALRRRVEHDLDELRVEFRGIFGPETIERYVADSIDELPAPASRPIWLFSSNASPAATCVPSPRSKEPS